MAIEIVDFTIKKKWFSIVFCMLRGRVGLIPCDTNWTGSQKMLETMPCQRFKKQKESPHVNILKKFLLINRLVVN